MTVPSLLKTEPLTRMTEAEMQDGIVAAAKVLGYLTHHNLYSVGSGPGFPDLTICGHGRLYAFEIKGPRGKVRPEQEAWIAALEAAGINAYFIWPQDYEFALELLQSGSRET